MPTRRTTCSTCCPASRGRSRCGASPSSEAGTSELRFSALRADGGEARGFAFERTTDGVAVTYTAGRPVDAGIRVELALPPTRDPQWLVPGVFYGENRVERCTRIYPRFVAGRSDPDAMEADAWSFRADRCSTPAVFAGGGGLATSERSPVGPA
jgi:hypothetical protein